MICPKCGSEYRESYVRCADCGVDLIQPASPSPSAEVALVKVYETGNPAIIPVLESLFDDAGIEYMAKGEPIQDLFGLGRFSTGLNYAIGPVEFYVSEDDAEDAREIVKTLGQPPPPANESESD